MSNLPQHWNVPITQTQTIGNQNWVVNPQTSTAWPWTAQSVFVPHAEEPQACFDINGNPTVTATCKAAEIFSDVLVIASSFYMTHGLHGKNYTIHTEYDLNDIERQPIRSQEIISKAFQSSTLAFDNKLKRLELVITHPIDSPISNIGALLDDSFQFVQDKSLFLNTLVSRLIPIVNYTLDDISGSSGKKLYANLTFKASLLAGILPIVHASNLVFNNVLAPSKKEYAYVLSHLNEEYLITDKTIFPEIQNIFTPEYGYLTLKQGLQPKDFKLFGATSEDLKAKLVDLCVPGTNPALFVDYFVDSLVFDQRILDVEDRANSIFKYLLETNYI